MAEKLKGIPFDASEIILPDGTLGYDNVIYSADFAEWLATYFKNGVLVPGGAMIDTELQVIKVDDLHVKVSIGNMVINGRTAYIPEEITLDISPSEPDLLRVDRVVVELNLGIDVNCFRLKVIEGTMAADPVAPELTRTDEVYQMSLAAVTVDVMGITEVEDERPDDDLCGISQVLIGVKPPLPVTGDSAANISYDGSTSGLTGVNVQDAIDELVATDYTKTLTAANWATEDSNSVQTLVISGFTTTMKPPFVDLIPANANDVTQWGYVWKVETLLNSIKFYATQAPTSNLSVKVRVIR